MAELVIVVRISNRHAAADIAWVPWKLGSVVASWQAGDVQVGNVQDSARLPNRHSWQKVIQTIGVRRTRVAHPVAHFLNTRAGSYIGKLALSISGIS
jgi:hypothetical protein